MNALEFLGLLFLFSIGYVFGTWLYRSLLKDLCRKFKKWIKN